MEPNRTFPFFFKKIFKQQNTVADIQQEVNLEIDSLLEMDNHDGLNIFINNSIKFTKPQINKILFKNTKPFIHAMSDEARGKFMKNNKSLIAEVICDKLIEGIDYMARNDFYDKKYYTVEINDNSRDYLIQFKNAYELFGSPFGQYVFKGEGDSIYKVYSASLSVRKSFERIFNKFKGSNFDRVTTGFRDGVQKQLTDNITALYNEANNERLNNLANKLNQLELNDVKASMLNNITQSINNFKIESLPVSCQNLIKEINDSSNEIKEQLDKLGLEDKLKFENLTSKRVPQVIQEYIVIPDKLKNIGGKDSPNHLLENSLDEIKDKLFMILQNSQDSQIDTMKKTNRYLRNL